MAKPVLVLMAAGLGSRFGGLKQLQPMDGHGHLIIDFSLYDAIRAGFEEAVFIIRPDMEREFQDTIGRRIGQHINARLAFQDNAMLPEGMALPVSRTKPLGTTHAVLCARDAIAGRPFAAINADDYYGPEAFRLLYDFLSAEGSENEQLMVNYSLENTLSPTGPVSRGICLLENGYLSHIDERKRITPCDGGGQYDEPDGSSGFIPAGTPVSMNCWGFRSGIMPLLREEFFHSLEAGLAEKPDTFEDILPTAVQALMADGSIRVKAVSSPDSWFGVTYREDMPAVAERLSCLRAQGTYPEKLWE